MSMFTGIVNKTAGLRTEYYEIPYSVIAAPTAATSKATAKMVGSLKHAHHFAFIDNATDVDLTVYVVHPDLDGDLVVGNRLLFVKASADRVLNFATGSAPGIFFDPGTKIYIAAESGTPTQGTFKWFGW